MRAEFVACAAAIRGGRESLSPDNVKPRKTNSKLLKNRLRRHFVLF